MKVLKSLEELLYELVSWLVFYPVTMWRSVANPLKMMRYADVELADRPEDQYDETLSPPLFLLITLLLSHGLSTAFPSISDPSQLPEELSSNTNLLIARGVIYGVYPLTMAVQLLRAKSVKIARSSLRPPFYSQCYVAAPFVFLVGLAGDLLLIPQGQGTAPGLIILAAAIVWYGQVQVRWIKRDLTVGTVKAVETFLLSFLAATLAAGCVTIVLALAFKK
ncbi:MAG: permease [Allorhizobium sp.]